MNVFEYCCVYKTNLKCSTTLYNFVPNFLGVSHVRMQFPQLCQLGRSKIRRLVLCLSMVFQIVQHLKGR